MENCNGVDDDCDGLLLPDEVDDDLDGALACDDCDDTDPALNLDDVDQDGFTTCDGDCDDLDPGLAPIDADGDGLNPCDGDCNETDPDVYAGAPDICDGVMDNDCDGVDDDGETDGDGDGTSDCDGDCDDTDPALNIDDADGDGVSSCQGDCDDNDPAVGPDDDDADGWSVCTGDCDDNNPEVYPGAADICDGIEDNDCDGLPDPQETDDDADGTTECGGDCDDADPALNIDDADGDGVSSCDGDCDDTDPAVGPTDGDGDGVSGCDGDCDDTNPAVYPGAPDICDGVDDNDCDGNADHQESDSDGDGASLCGGDCNDADPSLNPDDGDGDGFSTCTGDCDDSNADVYPGADDLCDAVMDNDCDGVPDPQEVDDDGDGVSECEGDCDDSDPAAHVDDTDGDGASPCDGDCDDDDASVYPGAPDVCDGVADNDCDGVTDPLEDDADGDGVTGCDGDCDDDDPATYPDADEFCDGEDRDCDGVYTDGCASCAEILDAGLDGGDGDYEVDLDGIGGGDPVDVYCDMTTDGGGWTLIQRTTDDWADTGMLTTDYATYYGSTLGDLGGAYRLAGEFWTTVGPSDELLLAVNPRLSDGSACDGDLYYQASSLGLDIPPGGPATASGYSQPVTILTAATLSTTDSGPSTNCVNLHGATPWFLGACCDTCPTYGGNYYNPPSPMVRYLDTDADMYGNLADDVCDGVLDQASVYEGATALEFYLR